MKTQVTITEITQEDLVDFLSTAFDDSNYLLADYDEDAEIEREPRTRIDVAAPGSPEVFMISTPAIFP